MCGAKNRRHWASEHGGQRSESVQLVSEGFWSRGGTTADVPFVQVFHNEEGSAIAKAARDARNLNVRLFARVYCGDPDRSTRHGVSPAGSRLGVW